MVYNEVIITGRLYRCELDRCEIYVCYTQQGGRGMEGVLSGSGKQGWASIKTALITAGSEQKQAGMICWIIIVHTFMNKISESYMNLL